jgi:hypothetical protein
MALLAVITDEMLELDEDPDEVVRADERDTTERESRRRGEGE